MLSLDDVGEVVAVDVEEDEDEGDKELLAPSTDAVCKIEGT